MLDAAATLFARQGFRGTGVDELAAEADVALSSIYANFTGGKADVYLALACRVAARHATEMIAAIDAAAPPVEVAVFDEYRRFHRENPLAFRLIGLADVAPDDTALYADARAMIHRTLADLVDRATAASALDPVSSRREVLRLWATVNGLLALRVGRFVDAAEIEALLDVERADVAARVTKAVSGAGH